MYCINIMCLLFFLISGSVVHDAAEVDEPLEDRFSATADWNTGPTLPLNPTANGHAAKRKRADTTGKYDACKAA